MPDVSLIDNNPTNGPDNRPTGEAPWTGSAPTDANGTARVTFTVSMQPGNNYRAVASRLSNAVAQVTQTDADAINARNPLFPGASVRGCFDPLIWSPMLTVWRKLHVETDSMGAEPTIVGGREPDWQQHWVNSVAIGSTTTTLFVSTALTGNNAHQFEGGRLNVVNTGLTLPIYDHTSDAITINRVLTSTESALVQDNPVIIKDDDPDGPLLPKLFTIDQFIKNAYADAYIEIVELDSAYNPNRTIPFKLYVRRSNFLTGVGWNNSKDMYSSDTLWISLVVAGYQAGGLVADVGTNDNDPDPQIDNSTYPNPPYWSGGGYEETLVTGWTAGFGDYDSLIFRAAVVDFPKWPFYEDQVVAHEIGHSGGNSGTPEEHHAEGGLMNLTLSPYDTRFTGITLKRFREASKW